MTALRNELPRTLNSAERFARTFLYATLAVVALLALFVMEAVRDHEGAFWFTMFALTCAGACVVYQ